MPTPRNKIVDPLEKLKEGVRATVEGAVRPVPLVATAIAVRIEGGIAVVTTDRIFRNIEEQDIEPTLTFPVPTAAALFSLSAEIDGRRIEGECKPKETARETYEDALDRGKAAVLHEELLKGVHMVSVGRVRPGAEVKGTSIWTAPLSFVGGEPGLRVPTTVGEIYGRQPLPDSDALTVGGHVHRATVIIECPDAKATLLGGPREVAKGGGYEVALDAPIEIAFARAGSRRSGARWRLRWGRCPPPRFAA
jgi:vault protein inter-alpha-trypsin-like protein